MIVKRFTIATFFVLIFIFGGQISELAINSNSIMNASKEKTTDNITEDLTVFSEGESIEIYEQIKSSSSQGLPEDSYLLPNSPKLWTLLIYMCADCNLEDAAIEDINELEYAGGTDLNINVLVLIDRIEGYDDSNGDWTTAKLFRIESDSVIGGNIVSTELADYGEINMGNWHTLNYFLEYGVTNYPAESYALILWNHGDSAFNCCIDDTKGEATTIYDHTDPANNDYYLSLFDIRDACQACSDYINIIAFDCCLSSQAELAYVLSEVTDLMVASQKVIPNDGYDYYTILTDLKANIGWNAFGLGNCIVDSYENFYKLSESNSQLSLINLGVMRTTFIQQLKNLAHNLTDAMDIIPMNLYIARQSSYFTGRTMDIVDFCNILYDLVDDVDLKESLDIFRDYIENSLILNNYVHSLSSGRLHGLSIFMPRYRVSWESQINWYIYYASQNLMPMAYESDWDSFLTAYYDPLEDLPNAMPYYTDLNIAEKGFLDKQTQDHYYIYDVDTTGVYYLRTDVL
ncbi:MAG: clostripain-related cysteine peptidase, partial [Candidatus Thorarchaeota archaeon]